MPPNRSRDPLLQAFRLGHLRLRNRIFSSAHAPAYVENGHPGERYRLYHEEKARGGIALTMVGGSTNIAADSPSVFGQLYAGDDSILPGFRALTEGVQQHGAAIFCQLTHMGRRTVNDHGHWLPALAPSAVRERAHRAKPKTMEREDIDRVINDFAAAAKRCQLGGFDGIELLAHSHLIGQFLSPLINRRQDAYGGSLHNRLRFALEVLEAVRGAVGHEMVLGLRLTADELLPGGIEQPEGRQIARELARVGQLDFLNILAGAPYDDLGLAAWIPPMGLPSAAHLSLAAQIKQAVDIPVLHAGGMADIATARHAIQSGALDMVGMTRAHIADPYLVHKLSRGEEAQIRPCVGMGYCVDRVNQGKDALCAHNAATGRETTLSHQLSPDPGSTPKQKVVIVGAGPAGLEAARLWASRGHSVVLMEASDRLGGQLILAAQSPMRQQIASIGDWLGDEVQRLGVDIRYHCYADAESVLGERPDWVYVATGGLPMPLGIEGEALCLSSWDLLSGTPLQGEVLLYDEQGQQAAATCAEVLARAGCQVHFATPDPEPLHELGPTTRSVAMRQLYQLGVVFHCDQNLVKVGSLATRRQATLENVLSQKSQVLEVDAVVIENATEALDALYHELKPDSKNHGQFNHSALIHGQLTLPELNPMGQYQLLRLGDAISHRGLHAAIYDAARFSQWAMA